MTRVLRYPFLSAVSCLSALACAIARDICVGEGLAGWARVLLVMTFVLLALCFMLLSCRFFVDESGVGVGFLLHIRRTSWDALASVGVLSCNSRRTYLLWAVSRFARFPGAAALCAGVRVLGLCRADKQKARPRSRRVLSAGNRLYARRRKRTPSTPAVLCGIRRLSTC